MRHLCRRGWWNGSIMTVWDCSFHSCASPTRFNLQAAPELHNPFSHACDADANRLSSRRMIQHSIGYPLPFVADLYHHSIGILPNLHLGFVGSRMEVNVC